MLINLFPYKRRFFYPHCSGNLQSLFQTDDTIITTLFDHLPQGVDLLQNIAALHLKFALSITSHFIHRAQSS